MGFAPDVFGGNRRQVESLTAQADFQRFQLEATYLTLTSNVVAAAIQEASLRAQVSSTLSIIKIETEMLDQLHQQFKVGYAAGLDVAAQEAALAQVQQTLPPLQKQLAQDRDFLVALAGRFPDKELEEKFELAALSLPQELPVSLPSKLVEQRPDVRAAEELAAFRQRPGRCRSRRHAAEYYPERQFGFHCHCDRSVIHHRYRLLVRGR